MKAQQEVSMYSKRVSTVLLFLLLMAGSIGPLLAHAAGQGVGRITARMLTAPGALMGPGPSSLNWSSVGAMLAYVEPKDGQDLLYKTERSSSHLVKGTQMNQFIAEQEKRGVKFVTYSVSEVVKNADEQSRIRQKFQKILAGN